MEPAKPNKPLSIIPPKQPLRCTSESYRLANGQREEGLSVCGKLSRGQHAAVRANQQQGISAVLMHGWIKLRAHCCQHEIFILETIFKKKSAAFLMITAGNNFDCKITAIAVAPCFTLETLEEYQKTD